MTNIIKQLFPFLQTKEERAENEAYQEVCLELAKKRGIQRAKDKYKEQS